MLSLLPLLKTRQELPTLPRGRKRFELYLEAMIGGTRDIVSPPPGFNPIPNEHAAEVVDSLIDTEAKAHTGTLLRLGGVEVGTVPRRNGRPRRG